MRTSGGYQIGRKDTGVFWNRATSTLTALVAGTTLITATATGVAINGKLQVGTTAINGLVGGAGTSATPYALGATAGSALDYRFSATHTTGDMRGMYIRLDFGAAGGSGEAIRAFAVANNVSVATGGTVNGIHSSFSISGASGAVSGAANALRATLGLGAGTTSSGTLSGVQVDADFASDATLSGTEAGIRFTTATSKKWPVAFAFDSVVGTGNAIEAATSNMGTNATAWAIHIKVDNTDGYIPVYDNKTWS